MDGRKGLLTDVELKIKNLMSSVEKAKDQRVREMAEEQLTNRLDEKERLMTEIVDLEKKVFEVSYECLMRSIELLKPGIPVCSIGNCIHDYAEEKGCSVVDQFVGHGVGIDFHEPPQIPHFRNNSDILLQPNMTFTIEPMINAGNKKAVIDETDHWTARTIDGKPSAQWEHTILMYVKRAAF